MVGSQNQSFFGGQNWHQNNVTILYHIGNFVILECLDPAKMALEPSVGLNNNIYIYTYIYTYYIVIYIYTTYIPVYIVPLDLVIVGLFPRGDDGNHLKRCCTSCI